MNHKNYFEHETTELFHSLQTLQMRNLPMLRTLQVSDFIENVDLKDACLCIKIHKQDRRFLKFE